MVAKPHADDSTPCAAAARPSQKKVGKLVRGEVFEVLSQRDLGAGASRRVQVMFLTASDCSD
eukprot:SAG11_NODE_7487_length_1137_cov_2.184008_2_plen_62_part_00